jgi:hypothetical protein
MGANSRIPACFKKVSGTVAGTARRVLRTTVPDTFLQARLSARFAIMAAAASAGLLIVVGCALDKNGVQPGKTFGRIGGHTGELLEPKQCLLKVAIISRPFGDPAINEVVWKAADEQIIPPRERHAWEVNGLRVGRIIGELPLELEAIMKDTTSHQKVNPTNFMVASGDPTLIKISDPVDEATVLVNRDNRISGNDRHDVSGYFRATAQHDGANNVSLRLVPEVHFGPIRRTFQTVPNAAAIGAQEFQINNGQEEDTFRELSTSLTLEPGQVAVLGCRPELKRGLGTLFFTQSVANSDQRMEKLILIWASRNLQGMGPNDRDSKASDRPALFKRLVGPAPTQGPARPAPAVPLRPGVDVPLADPTILAPGTIIKKPTQPSATKGTAPPSASEATSTTPTP